MKEIVLTFAYLLLFVAVYVHSRTNAISIPCNSNITNRENKNLLYKWTHYIPKVIHNSDRRHSILSNGTLLINEFTKKDQGKYVCQVKDGEDIIEEVLINVNDKYTVSSEIHRKSEPVKDNCPSYSCIGANKCTKPDITKVCSDVNDVCCPKMKQEDKHRCQHFLGECMEFCHANIHISRADDCPENTMCCVLV